MHSTRGIATLIARVVFVLVLVAGALLLLPRQAMDFTNSHAKPHEQGRIVSRKPWRVEPVNVVGARNKKKEKIDIDKAFDDDDDWLDGFVVTVRNGSDKIITAVTIEMIFPREPGDNRKNFLEELHFGPSPMTPEYIYRDPNKVIKPGETGDLEIGSLAYSSIKDALRKLSYPNSIRRVELRMREVGFEDGSVLLSGTLWIQDRNSPNDPTKKIRANKAKAPGARHHATRVLSGISKTPYSHSKPPALLNAAQSACFEQGWSDQFYCGLEGRNETASFRIARKERKRRCFGERLLRSFSCGGKVGLKSAVNPHSDAVRLWRHERRSLNEFQERYSRCFCSANPRTLINLQLVLT